MQHDKQPEFLNPTASKKTSRPNLKPIDSKKDDIRKIKAKISLHANRCRSRYIWTKLW